VLRGEPANASTRSGVVGSGRCDRSESMGPSVPQGRGWLPLANLAITPKDRRQACPRSHSPGQVLALTIRWWWSAMRRWA